MSILGNTSLDVNKILPMQRPWAWDLYKKEVANTWTPDEVPVQDDVEQWKSKTALTEDERSLILMNLGFFSTAESLTGSNLMMCVYKYIKDPACRQYIIRQAATEAIHVHMFIYLCDSLGLDPDVIYNMYKTQFETKEKDDFVIDLTSALTEENLDMNKDEDKKKLLYNLLGYYIIFEGIMFYAGFAMILALKNKNKMTSLGQQFEWTLRDESLHVEFGTRVIKDIIAENPQLWTDEFKQTIVEKVKQAVQLEFNYIEKACPVAVVGIPQKMFKQYIEYIADRRLESIGLPPQYKTENPFPWLSKVMDLTKETNFFEKRPTEYSIGTLGDWD